MNKRVIIAELLTKLESSLRTSERGRKSANTDAIEAEGRMQTRYGSAKEESQLLEAAFAGRIAKVASEIETLRRIDPADGPSRVVRPCSLVTLKIAELSENYFLLPTGGYEIVADGQSVTVVSFQSPIARLLMGKSKGDALILPTGEHATIYEIL